MEHYFNAPENGNYVQQNLNIQEQQAQQEQPANPVQQHENPVEQPENPAEMEEDSDDDLEDIDVGDAIMAADAPEPFGVLGHQVPQVLANPLALLGNVIQEPQPFVFLNPPPIIPMEARNGSHHESFREHARIPIYIVEDHDNVIPYVHENIRKKYLPAEGNCMIHFDSHPDMLIPRDMPAEDAFDAEKLYEWQTIENWLMPNCFNGIFHHLIWVKPPWSNQIRQESQKIFVGKCKQTGKIRLESRENYFISEGLFKMKNEMDSVKEISLELLTLGNRVFNAGGDDYGRMMQISHYNDKTPTVLDIDLDFFSTKNPFITIYEDADVYLRLKHLFKFTPPHSTNPEHIVQAQSRRTAQLDELQELFKYLNEHKTMPEFEGLQPSPNYVEVNSVYEAVAESYDVNLVDWELIYNAGCTIDDHELPEHISTPDELQVMYDAFKNFLDTFLGPPRIITIARSSIDDYTPQHQVEEIQAKVLEMLNAKFRCAPPLFHYLQQAQAAQLQPEPDAPQPEPEQPEPQQPAPPDVADDDSMEPVSTSSATSGSSSESGSGGGRTADEGGPSGDVPGLGLEQPGPSNK